MLLKELRAYSQGRQWQIVEEFTDAGVSGGGHHNVGFPRRQRFDLAQSVSLSVLLWVKSREETRPVPPLSLSSQKRHAMLIVCLCVWSRSL